MTGTRRQANPPELFDSLQYGFSQAVAASGARLIAVSGQVAWDRDLQPIGGDDLEAQARAALANLETALKALEASLADVLALRLYIVDFESQDSAAVTRALAAVFPSDAAPAATWIGVTALARPELKIEIEALALAD